MTDKNKIDDSVYLARDARNDPVNHPSHYTSVVPGIECIDVTEHFSFCRGNAIKYLWRAGAKGNLVQDLEKAIWYIERELANVRQEQKEHPLVVNLQNPDKTHSNIHHPKPGFSQ